VSNRIEDLEPVTRAMCEQLMAARPDLKLTHTLRTLEEQGHLYAKGRTLPGAIVTNAKPGSSAHNYGMAFDVAFVGKKPYPSDTSLWEAVGQAGEAVGLAWGGRWRRIKDYPHFERRDWKIAKAGGVAGVG
jgi:peptidoglycan L-alanyl-D-glutamate endopeptidase CwlK